MNTQTILWLISAAARSFAFVCVAFVMLHNAEAVTYNPYQLDVGPGEEIMLGGVHLFRDSVRIHGGGVLRVKTHDGTPDSGWVMIIAPEVEIGRHSRIDAVGRGDSGGAGQGTERNFVFRALCPGGVLNSYFAMLGHGGGYGGIGGSSGGDAIWSWRPSQAGYVGPSFGGISTQTISMGSGGGGWGGSSRGGGAVIIIAEKLSLSGEIIADGFSDGEFKGGGSGGGVYLLTKQLISNDGLISAKGGIGAYGFHKAYGSNVGCTVFDERNGGAGGGGGRVKANFPIAHITDVTGGAAGYRDYEWAYQSEPGGDGTVFEQLHFYHEPDMLGGHPIFIDLNRNGIPDYLEDLNGSGYPDIFEDKNGTGILDGFENPAGNFMPAWMNGRMPVWSTTHPISDLSYWYSADKVSIHWSPEQFHDVAGWVWRIDNQWNTRLDYENSEFELPSTSSVTRDRYGHGVWYFHLAPFDGDGTILTGQQRRISLRVNTHPPTITSASHPNPNQAYSSSLVQLRWGMPVGHETAAIRWYYAWNNSPNYIPSKQDLMMTNRLVAFTFQPAGTHYFHVVGEDSMGNLTPAAHYRVNIVQITGPIAGNPAIPITAPLHILPENNEILPYADVALVIGGFDDPQDEFATVFKTEWELWSAHKSEASLLWAASRTTGDVLAVSAPEGLFESGHTYLWRTRFKSSTGYWSAWSEPTLFHIAGAIVRPTADFEMFPTKGVAPFVVQFVDASTGVINGWEWDFGLDGFVNARVPNPSWVVFEEPGLYNAKLTVQGPGGTSSYTHTNLIAVMRGDAPVSISWLQEHNLPVDGSYNLLDLDGDGFSVWEEWRAGTNPTNAQSALVMGAGVPDPESGGFRIRWHSVTSRTYRVMRSSDLKDPTGFVSIASGVQGVDGVREFTDDSPNGMGPFIYRVEVEQQ
jgi:hypothetical protein